MITYIYLLLLLAMGHSYAGNSVGNGGDLIFCREEQGQPLAGWYVLDYVLSYRRSNQNTDIVQVEDWAAGVNRLSNLIKTKLPGLSESFEHFIKNLGNMDDFTSKRIWSEASFGLRDLEDENITRKVPSNCITEGKANIQQVVVRQEQNGYVIYNFDSRHYEELKKNSPLQFSFLLVHEWIRDYLKDAEQVREVVRKLHSDVMEHQTEYQLGKFFTLYGIFPHKLKHLGRYRAVGAPNGRNDGFKSSNIHLYQYADGFVFELVKSVRQTDDPFRSYMVAFDCQKRTPEGRCTYDQNASRSLVDNSMLFSFPAIKVSDDLQSFDIWVLYPDGTVDEVRFERNPAESQKYQ